MAINEEGFGNRWTVSGTSRDGTEVTGTCQKCGKEWPAAALALGPAAGFAADTGGRWLCPLCAPRLKRHGHYGVDIPLQPRAQMDKARRQAIAKGKRGEPGAKAAAKLPALPRMPGQKSKGKGKALRPCACGNCGQMTKGTWFPGHDAVCKSWALRVHRDICKIGEVPAEHREGAKRLLPTLKDVSKIAPKTALKLSGRGKANGKKANSGPKKVKPTAKAKVTPKAKAKAKAAPRKKKPLPGSAVETDAHPTGQAQPEAEPEAQPVTDAELGDMAAEVEEAEAQGPDEQ